MLNRNINFYLSALLITVVGAAAALVILKTALEVDSFHYTDEYFAPSSS